MNKYCKQNTSEVFNLITKILLKYWDPTLQPTQIKKL